MTMFPKAARLGLAVLLGLTVLPGLTGAPVAPAARAETSAAPSGSLAESQAETPAPGPALAALPETLRMAETFAVLAEEGLDYGQSIEDQMFPGRGGARWLAVVARIYDSATLRQTFDDSLINALRDDPETVAAAQAFFGSELGQRVLGLEIKARRALLDEAVDEAARVEAERMQAERDPRMGLLRDFIEAGDLIEMNVAGALTSNLAFFQGMAEVGAPGMALDHEQIMTDVWSQEDSIRDETTKWLYSYLALAYGPLSEAEMKAYLAFVESPEGQRLNVALFAAFDQVFDDVSHQLGRGAALILQGNDI